LFLSLGKKKLHLLLNPISQLNLQPERRKLITEKKKRESELSKLRASNHQEIQKYRKRLQQLEKVLNGHMRVIRTAPLGRDRYHRRYWWLEGRLPGGLLYREDPNGQWHRFESNADVVTLINTVCYFFMMG
jgi:hypothetical protein